MKNTYITLTLYFFCLNLYAFKIGSFNIVTKPIHGFPSQNGIIPTRENSKAIELKRGTIIELMEYSPHHKMIKIRIVVDDQTNKREFYVSKHWFKGSVKQFKKNSVLFPLRLISNALVNEIPRVGKSPTQKCPELILTEEEIADENDYPHRKVIKKGTLFPTDFKFSGGDLLDMHSYKYSRGQGKRVKLRNVRQVGENNNFGDLELTKYKKLYCSAKFRSNNILQFNLTELTQAKKIATSKNPDQLVYGASISKIFAAGSYLNNTKSFDPSMFDSCNYKLDRRQSQKLMVVEALNSLIIRSNNKPWKCFQNAAATEIDNKESEGIIYSNGHTKAGHLAVTRYFKSMGITNSRGYTNSFVGDSRHNRISANDVATFMQEIYNRAIQYNDEGADLLLKTMFLTTTGKSRGNKYIPRNINVGGKTGSLSNPASNHHAMLIPFNGKLYSLTLISKKSPSIDLAIMAGGLFRQFIKVSIDEPTCI